MKMGMGGNNANTWDGEVEHLRKKMKERMQWMDQKFGFTEPAQPVVTAPVDPEIHEPNWQKDTVKVDTLAKDTLVKDTVKKDTTPKDTSHKPIIKLLDDFSRLSPTNYYVVNGNRLEIQTDLGGTFALVDLNGAVLFKKKIKTGTTFLEIPVKARDKHWIATLNGKMLSK